MKPHPKQSILQFLKEQYPEFLSGASIEDREWGGKKSCAGRALRRLYSEGLLEREYRKLENRNDEQVFYRAKMPTDQKEVRQFFQDAKKLRVDIITLPTGERIAKEILV